jgi:hypothetical protein
MRSSCFGFIWILELILSQASEGCSVHAVAVLFQRLGRRGRTNMWNTHCEQIEMKKRGKQCW